MPDVRLEMIEKAEEKLPRMPVPRLPEHFSTPGWYVRPDIISKELTHIDPLFQLRIVYDDGHDRAHRTIVFGTARLDPARCKDVVYREVVEAIADIRARLMICV